MSINSMLIINFSIILLLLFLVIYLFFRVKKLEDKSVDVSSKDIIAFVDQMRELVVESERVAERLDVSIKEREAILEDLSDLVQNRIERLNKLNTYEANPTIENLPLGDNPIQNRVYQLFLQGLNEAEIASELGISITEVTLIINMVNK